VAGPAEALQGPEIGENLGAERVQMEVAHQFEQVRFLLDHNRLVPILKEVADAVVPPVESPGVATEQ
jgi:hypothetical protein